MRQTNLIFHNIVESMSKEPHIRKQHDINEATGLLSEYMNVKCSIKNALSLGKNSQWIAISLFFLRLTTFTSIEERIVLLYNYVGKVLQNMLRIFT